MARGCRSISSIWSSVMFADSVGCLVVRGACDRNVCSGACTSQNHRKHFILSHLIHMPKINSRISIAPSQRKTIFTGQRNIRFKIFVCFSVHTLFRRFQVARYALRGTLKLKNEGKNQVRCSRQRDIVEVEGGCSKCSYSICQKEKMHYIQRIRVLSEEPRGTHISD